MAYLGESPCQDKRAFASLLVQEFQKLMADAGTADAGRHFISGLYPAGVQHGSRPRNSAIG